MRFRSLCAVGLAMLAAPLAGRAETVTEANWRRHPVIAEVRAIYGEFRHLETAGRLRKEHRTLGDCNSYDEMERTLRLDKNGTPRSYRTVRGSEDSLARSAYYYDRAGALRFVFVQAGAVNGTAVEYRVYLSKAGERLWEEQRHLKGPGYTFPSQLPDDWLVRDAVLAFHAEPPCPEEK
jgi:hypothetical protein